MIKFSPTFKLDWRIKLINLCIHLNIFSTYLVLFFFTACSGSNTKTFNLNVDGDEVLSKKIILGSKLENKEWVEIANLAHTACAFSDFLSGSEIIYSRNSEGVLDFV